MGTYHSADHIAEDHIHTDITCNIEEPQQKYRLGTSVIDYWGAFNFGLFECNRVKYPGDGALHFMK